MKHLTIITFMAFDREHQQTFISEAPIMLHEAKILIEKFASTSIIKKIQHWQGNLLNTETFENKDNGE